MNFLKKIFRVKTKLPQVAVCNNAESNFCRFQALQRELKSYEASLLMIFKFERMSNEEIYKKYQYVSLGDLPGFVMKYLLQRYDLTLQKPSIGIEIRHSSIYRPVNCDSHIGEILDTYGLVSWSKNKDANKEDI